MGSAVLARLQREVVLFFTLCQQMRTMGRTGITCSLTGVAFFSTFQEMGAVFLARASLYGAWASLIQNA